MNTEVHSLSDVALVLPNLGYVSGEDDGIVTVGGMPRRCEIVVFDMDLTVVSRWYSLDNGHYLITNLDPTKKYLLMARDYKGEYEPCCWDYVTPKDDKTLEEQMELWQSWQD